jgi:hypothetical protein
MVSSQAKERDLHRDIGLGEGMDDFWTLRPAVGQDSNPRRNVSAIVQNSEKIPVHGRFSARYDDFGHLPSWDLL